MNRREAIATLGAAVAAPKIFSERQTARMNMARTMEGVPEIEGPAFQSYDAWVDTSVKKVESEFLPRMKEISDRMEKIRTYAQRVTFGAEITGLAHAVARRMGGLRIPAMQRVLSPLAQGKFGLSRIFLDDFGRELETVCRGYPFLMAGGKVRADLVVNYAQDLTRLPFNAKNNATLDRLRHAEFTIPDRELAWKTLARFCNQLNVQIDPAPFGYKDEFRNGKPESIEIADAGPLWRMTYSHTDQGMKYDGEVVRHENGTRWIFAPENSPPGVSRVLRGSYYPDKILVKHPPV